jgi:hypothetical protein
MNVWTLDDSTRDHRINQGLGFFSSLFLYFLDLFENTNLN